MAITEDASQPTQIATGTGSGNLTSAAFSPPANTLLVALVGGGWGNSGLMDATITDTGGHTWTPIAKAQGTSTGARGLAAVYCTYLSSAPGSITVSAAFTNLQAGRYLAVRVLNGAASSQSSATGATRVVAAVPADGTAGQITMTTTKTGSMIYGVADDCYTQASFTRLGNTSVISEFDDPTDFITLVGWKSASATTTPGSTTFGGTWSSASAANVAAFEVLPAQSAGSATLTGSGQLTPTATYQQQTSATLTGQGTLSAPLTWVQEDSATLTGQGVVNATGAVSSGSVNLVGSGLLGELDGVDTTSTTSVLTGSGQITPLLTLVQPDAATLAGSGLLAANAPLLIAEGITTLSGAGVLGVGSPAQFTSISAVLTGSGVLLPSAVMHAVSATALSGSGLLAVAATRVVTPAVVLGGSGTLSEAAVRGVLSTAALAGSGQLRTALSGRTAFPAVTLSGQGVLSVGGDRWVMANASLTGAGLLTVGAPFTASATRTNILTGSGQLTVAAVDIRRTGMLLRGAGRLAVEGVVQSGAAVLLGQGSLTAFARAGVTGSEFDAAATVAGRGVLGIQASGGPALAAVLTGSGQLLVITANVVGGAAVLAGSGTLGVLAYIPVLPSTVAPQFPAAPFTVLHQPVVTTFTVGNSS